MPTGGSFTDIKKSGAIKMTNGHVRNESTENNVLGVLRHTSVLWSGAPCRCSTTIEEQLEGTFTENGDLSYWRDRFPNVATFSDEIRLDQNQIERMKTEVFDELFTTYDLGTEMAEAHDALRLFHDAARAVRHPLREFKELRDRILRKYKVRKHLVNKQDPIAEEIGQLWMQYRYAIMPLVYSVHDVMDLHYQSKNLYKTVRRRVKGEIIRNDPGDAEDYFYTFINGVGVVANITAKGRWSSQASRAFSQVRINPVSTAWEVIPYSFVVDWFVNVGSYLNAVASSLTTTAVEHKACVAIRESYQADTYCRIKIDDSYSVTKPYDSCEVSAGLTRPKTYTGGGVSYLEGTLSTKVVDNYSRVLFKPFDLSLAYAPFINWKRAIDALVLGNNNAIKALRRLK
jgi:hypothetical protein